MPAGLLLLQTASILESSSLGGHESDVGVDRRGAVARREASVAHILSNSEELMQRVWVGIILLYPPLCY